MIYGYNRIVVALLLGCAVQVRVVADNAPANYDLMRAVVTNDLARVKKIVPCSNLNAYYEPSHQTVIMLAVDAFMEKAKRLENPGKKLIPGIAHLGAGVGSAVLGAACMKTCWGQWHDAVAQQPVVQPQGTDQVNNGGSNHSATPPPAYQHGAGQNSGVHNSSTGHSDEHSPRGGVPMNGEPHDGGSGVGSSHTATGRNGDVHSSSNDHGGENFPRGDVQVNEGPHDGGSDVGSSSGNTATGLVAGVFNAFNNAHGQGVAKGLNDCGFLGTVQGDVRELRTTIQETLRSVGADARGLLGVATATVQRVEATVDETMRAVQGDVRELRTTTQETLQSVGGDARGLLNAATATVQRVEARVNELDIDGINEAIHSATTAVDNCAQEAQRMFQNANKSQQRLNSAMLITGGTLSALAAAYGLYTWGLKGVHYLATPFKNWYVNYELKSYKKIIETLLRHKKIDLTLTDKQGRTVLDRVHEQMLAYAQDERVYPLLNDLEQLLNTRLSVQG